MAERPEDAVTVSEAARLLGLQPHTVMRLIENDQLGGVVVYERTMTGRPRRRRSFSLTRQDVEHFLERARVKPGKLRHLSGRRPSA